MSWLLSGGSLVSNNFDWDNLDPAVKKSFEEMVHKATMKLLETGRVFVRSELPKNCTFKRPKDYEGKRTKPPEPSLVDVKQDIIFTIH